MSERLDENIFLSQEILSAIGAELIVEGAGAFSAIATDTRKDNGGKLFFALKGETYDAHDYLEKALESGATGLVVERVSDTALELAKKQQVTIFKVSQTLKALQDLALFWRKKLDPKVVAITGSNGKTTTKEFAAQIASEKYKTLYSKGSFNNHFGVPLSLLELRPHHEVVIQEMGMNHPGEIKELVQMTDPDIVLVTTVGRAHLEGLGSLEAIALAKEEIYQWARPAAIRIVNMDNPYTRSMRDRFPKESSVVTFSSHESSVDVQLKEVVSKLEFMELSGIIGGEPEGVKVEVFGRQNLNNLMAAAAVGLACGLEPDLVWRGLKKCKTVWGRNQILKTDSGAKVIFDAYNANPDSVSALVENVSRLNVSGKRVAILGEMLEMGGHSDSVHEEVGEKIGEGQYDIVWFVGPSRESFERGLRKNNFQKSLYISNSYDEDIATKIQSVLQAGDIVLIKGSRGMKLERVLEQWKLVGFGSKD